MIYSLFSVVLNLCGRSKPREMRNGLSWQQTAWRLLSQYNSYREAAILCQPKISAEMLLMKKACETAIRRLSRNIFGVISMANHYNSVMKAIQ